MKKKKRRRQIGRRRRRSKSKKQGRRNEEEEKKSIFIKVLGENLRQLKKKNQKLKKERNVKGEQKLPITNSEVNKINMYTCLN